MAGLCEGGNELPGYLKAIFNCPKAGLLLSKGITQEATKPGDEFDRVKKEKYPDKGGNNNIKRIVGVTVKKKKREQSHEKMESAYDKQEQTTPSP
ncbi:hypothetical protein ANN_06634 [Periplaneta americana]|uniref:Uncharacterized protein n=1 Tax=Periplaneta americana TaxID=6978 RepID=A0ABQ8TE26_PERAM|nr:hypothetical protein ANN_06634 [Periplaneta americana]